MDIVSTLITPEVMTAVFQAILGLVLALVSAVLAVGLRFLRTRLTAEQFNHLQDVAAMAVLAAEQLGYSQIVGDKKTAATEMASRELARRGIRVDAGSLDAAIEAAVMDAFNIAKVNEPTL